MKKNKKTLSAAQKTFQALKKVDKPYQSVLIPLVRQAIPSMIAADIVGVQPMSAPDDVVGSIHGVDFTFEQFGQALKEYSDEKDAKNKDS